MHCTWISCVLSECYVKVTAEKLGSSCNLPSGFCFKNNFSDWLQEDILLKTEALEPRKGRVCTVSAMVSSSICMWLLASLLAATEPLSVASDSLQYYLKNSKTQFNNTEGVMRLFHKNSLTQRIVLAKIQLMVFNVHDFFPIFS